MESLKTEKSWNFVFIFLYEPCVCTITCIDKFMWAVKTDQTECGTYFSRSKSVDRRKCNILGDAYKTPE